MNVWFGPSWGAPVCQTTEHVETPVGQPCPWCDEEIAEGDSGIGTRLLDHVDGELRVTRVAYHVECWVRQIVGSVHHQLRVCRCFGGPAEEEPSTLSKREEARAAWALARERARTLELGAHDADA